MKKNEVVKNNRDFERIIKEGKYRKNNEFIIYYLANSLDRSRFGISVGKKIGNAVERNYYKRVIRNICDKAIWIDKGKVLDIGEVYEDLFKFIGDHHYNVQCLGYDPYNAPVFINRWEIDYGPYGIEKVPQGMKTETVPLGEIKIMAERRQLFFDEQIMMFCMGNCVAQQDTNGNRKLLKRRRQEKIDNVAALLDAYVAYKANKDMFE